MALCLNKSVENELRAIPGNNVCCDCDDRLPQWASISFGTFMCLECSGRHRALGVHISFVRSVSMDSWNDKQIQMMRVGGNQKCIDFLKQYGIPKDMPIAQKYNQPPALLYRERVKAAAEGLPLPTELPSNASNNSSSYNRSTSNNSLSSNMSRNSSGTNMSSGTGTGSATGSSTPTTPQGSDPLPGESEADYVARQRKLQEEARERMRAKFGGSSGLNSGGKFMGGVGSDPNYNPSASASSGGGGSLIDVDQLAAQASSAFSFIGGAVSEWSKSMTETDPNAAKARTSSSSGTSSSSSAYSGSGSAWGSLTAGVGDFWKAATSATEDIVTIVTKPDEYEENYSRFPRPPTSGYGGSSSSNTTTSSSINAKSKYTGISSSSSSSTGIASPAGKNSRVANADSWDDMDDSEKPVAQKKGPVKKSSNNSSATNLESMSGASSSSSSSGSSPRTGTVSGSGSALRLKNPSSTSTGSLDGMHSRAAAAAGTSPTATGTTATPGSKGPQAPSPVGDDFFSTFGV